LPLRHLRLISWLRVWSPGGATVNWPLCVAGSPSPTPPGDSSVPYPVFTGF